MTAPAGEPATRPPRVPWRDGVTILFGLWMIAAVFADGWAHLQPGQHAGDVLHPVARRPVRRRPRHGGLDHVAGSGGPG